MFEVWLHQPFLRLFLYSLEHRCPAAGCGSVLVFDGNCKNYRDVCKARDAGYVEYEGLKGVVKTGCMNTPKLQSRFCELHSENVAVPQQLDTEVGITQDTSQDAEEGVVAMITAKRSTRSGVSYQVSCYCGIHHTYKTQQCFMQRESGAHWNLLPSPHMHN